MVAELIHFLKAVGFFVALLASSIYSAKKSKGFENFMHLSVSRFVIEIFDGLTL